MHPIDEQAVSATAAALRAVGCVFADDEARLLVPAARTPAELAAMVDRRAAGFPLEQILGWAQFCGLRVWVEPGVFVPRRRSEFLVQQAATLASPGAVIVDLCCGTGAIGAALSTALDPVELHAVDVDPVAVRCARRNVAGTVHQGDLYEPLPASLRRRVDLLLANTPYVPTGEIAYLPTEARVHESRAALDGGADGLDVQRRVSATAREWLAPGGHLLVETSERQAPAAAEIFAGDGLVARTSRAPDLDATVVIGTAPARDGSGRASVPRRGDGR